MAHRPVLDALKRRVAQAHTRDKLAQLASELGHSLSVGHLDAEAAHALSRAAGRARRGRAGFDEGYLTALADVLGAVGAAAADVADRAMAERALEGAPVLRRMVRALHESPQGPSALARAIGMASNDGRVTRHLQKLEALGLVEPAPSANKKERLRQLTARGHRIAAMAASLAEPAESHSPDRAVVEDVVGMLHLVLRCGDVSLSELAACAGSGPASESLAREFAMLGERRGLLDVTTAERCVWGREQIRWRDVLEGYATRPDALRAAFAAVPRGFVLCTDEVDAWRLALRSAQVEGVEDIGSYHFASTMLAPGEVPAIVSADETAARYLATQKGMTTQRGPTETRLYAATAPRAEVVIEKVTA